MSTIHCHTPAAKAVEEPLAHEQAFNLYDATPGFIGTPQDRPRDVTEEEEKIYLRWLAHKRGVEVPEDATYSGDGIFDPATKAIILPMPGYDSFGASQTVTCEIMGDDGEVVRTIVLPLDRAGKLPMTKEQVQGWSGLEKVRKRRATAKPAKAEPIPVAAPVSDGDLFGAVSALVDRIASLESTLAGGLAGLAPVALPVEAEPGERASGEALAARDAYIATLTAERDEARGELADEREAREVERAADRAIVADLRARDLEWSTGNIRDRQMISHLRARRSSTARRLLDMRERAALDSSALTITVAEVRRLQPVADAIASLMQAPPPSPGLRLVAAA